MSPQSTAPSGQALPAGTRLEEFEVEKVLGTGGFGITYLARDTSLGRKVVIKENLPAMFASRDTGSGTVRPRSDLHEDTESFAWSLENFLREADTLASLAHPGIVSVIRKFEANGTAYFVMPFEKGLPLDEFLENRNKRGERIAEDEIRGFLEHVLDALGYLHARGIYHRDIKPGNILVTREGVPILIDFGSARQRLSERSMTVIESPGYTPFEQLESRGNIGPWSDLYALGATVAKSIAGERPPKANDRVFDDPWSPLAGRTDLDQFYSDVLLRSIDKALEPNTAKRFQDAGEWLAYANQLSEVPAEHEAGAIEWLMESANNCDPDAQFALAVRYAAGNGVEQDDTKASEWFRRAAGLGVVDAQYFYGLRCAAGRGVTQSEPEAVLWLRRAADQNYGPAKTSLQRLGAGG